MGHTVQIDDETMQKLEALASRHGHSVEEELRAAVGRIFATEDAGETAKERLARLRDQVKGRRFTSAAVLVRDMRDTR